MTDPYRVPTRTEAEVEKHRAFWMAKYWFLARFFGIALSIGGGLGLLFTLASWLAPKPPEPYQCRDSEEITGPGSDVRRCGPDQTMDTTRLAEYRVLVRCWCPGHQPKGEQ